MLYDIEHTDTFGGQANYSWCHRETLSLSDSCSERSLVMAVKSAMGLTGIRCRRETMGETIALYPHNSCTVLFISPRY